MHINNEGRKPACVGYSSSFDKPPLLRFLVSSPKGLESLSATFSTQ
jgi:hypothetical protein